jgi:hypothetical protein
MRLVAGPCRPEPSRGDQLVLDVLDRVKPDKRGGRGPRAAPSGTALWGAAVLATVAAALLAALGGTPGPLLVVVLLNTTFGLAQVMRPASAVPAAVLVVLLTIAVMMQLFPLLHVPLALGDVTVLCVLSLLPLTLLWIRHSPLRLPDGDDVLVAASCLVVPAVALLGMVVVAVRSSGPKLAWAMANDSTFNVMTARFVVDDGGVDLGRHFNVAPLTSELVALFMVPGRSSLAPADLMQHDVARATQVLLLLLAVMSVGGSLIVASAVPTRHRHARAILAVCAGLVPWSWFVGGYSFQYGFWNAIVAGVVLVMSWLAWTQAPHSPRVGSAVQACAATVLLTVWVPLVLVPAGFGTVLVLRHWRTHLALRRWALALWSVPVVLFLVFGYVLTRPTVATSTTALAFDGAFFAIAHSTPGVVALVTLAVVLLSSSLRGERWELLGGAVVVILGWLGLHYLMGQRATSPTGEWGYYPQKFSWLMCVLAPYVVAAAVAGSLPLVRGGRAAAAAVVTAALAASAAVMAQIPPADSRPPSTEGNPSPRPAPDYRATSMFFPLSVARRHGASDFDDAARQMFAWSSPEDKILAARWFHDRSLEGFTDFWLLQQPITTGYPAVRNYAYTLDSRSAVALCAVVDTWGGGVTLETRSSTLERQMRRACPTARFTVHLVDGGLVPSGS